MFLDEIAARLQQYGVGMIATDGSDTPYTIYIGAASVIPKGGGPYMTLTETGGTAPVRVQNLPRGILQRPTAQVFVRATKMREARDMAKSAYDVLDGLFNTTVEGIFYVAITARQEPTDFGFDEQGRACIGFNIDAEKQPS